MSRIVTETVESKSDLTGKAATESRSFTVSGVDYELDLTEAEAGVFDRTLGKYTSKAHGVNPQPEVLREWARSNGHDVGERGRLSSELRDAFVAAQAGVEPHDSIDSE